MLRMIIGMATRMNNLPQMGPKASTIQTIWVILVGTIEVIPDMAFGTMHRLQSSNRFPMQMNFGGIFTKVTHILLKMFMK